MTRSYLILCLSFLATSLAFGQVNTQTAYNFIDQPASSRVAGLGGVVNSIMDNDLSLAYGNPALLNPSMDNQSVFSYSSFLAKSGYGYFSYGKDVKDVGTFAVNILYMNYGSFNETDISGDIIGQFKAKETALNFAGSRQIFDRLTAGAQLKFIFSNLEQYSSFGMGVDAGLNYTIEEELFTAAFVLKNMGGQLTSYYSGGEKLAMPFNIQIGVTKKMKHAPFRLGFVMDNLQNWNLSYTDPNLVGKKDPLTGEPIVVEQPSFANELLRHMIFSGELIIEDAFRFEIAYNFRRQQELKVTDSPGISGLSFGLGISIKSFTLSYSLASYTQGGTSNQFTLALRFNEMKKEKTLN
jgi:hypothetical protein